MWRWRLDLLHLGGEVSGTCEEHATKGVVMGIETWVIGHMNDIERRMAFMEDDDRYFYQPRRKGQPAYSLLKSKAAFIVRSNAVEVSRLQLVDWEKQAAERLRIAKEALARFNELHSEAP